MPTSVRDLVETAQRHAWNLAHELPAGDTHPTVWNRDVRAYLNGWEQLAIALDRALDGTVSLPSLYLRERGGPTSPLPSIARITDLVTASHELLVITPHTHDERVAYRDSIAAIGETVTRLALGHLERTTSGQAPELRNRRVTALEVAVDRLRRATSTLPSSRAAAMPDLPAFTPDDLSLGAVIHRWRRSLNDNPALNGPAIAPQALQAVAVDAALIVRTLRDHGPATLSPRARTHLEVLSRGWISAARSWGVSAIARPPATHSSTTSGELTLTMRELHNTRRALTSADTTQATHTLGDVGALYLARCKQAISTRSVLLPAALVARQGRTVLPSVHLAARRHGWVPVAATNPIAHDVLAAAGALQPMSRHLRALVNKPPPAPATPHGHDGRYIGPHIPRTTLG